MIDWAAFTPVAAVTGGVLIGAAAAALVLLNGRIAGVSGIVGAPLVGVGTRYAGGCTSGHDVCGLSRLSLRSLLATLTFMTAGFVTVYVMRHASGI